MRRYTCFVLLCCIIISCKSVQRSTNPEQWTDDQVNEWFMKREWLGATDLQPDPSINKKEFAVRYHQQRDRWDKAFNYLKNEAKDQTVIQSFDEKTFRVGYGISF